MTVVAAPIEPTPAQADLLEAVFSPCALGPLQLRNRLVRTAAFEGMCPNGEPGDALIDHHRAIAAGGVAMSTVAYASVSPLGRSYASQMVLGPRLLPTLRRLTHAVHEQGAAAAIQVGHCGGFASRKVIGQAPWGPSPWFNLYGLSIARAMSYADLRDVTNDFGHAAEIVRDAGFDAIELHMGHGYLLSQFLSPATNWRKDDFGGSFENRIRFPLQVLREVRRVLGPDFPVLVKLNLHDGFEGGFGGDEVVRFAQALAGRGATALVLSGGFVSKTPFFMLRGALPVRDMVRVQHDWLSKVGLALFGRLLVPEHDFERAFFQRQAAELRQAVDLPMVLVGGLRSRGDLLRARREGFDLLALGRPLVIDPDWPNKLRAGSVAASACEPCNRCIAEMDRGGVRCVVAS